MSDQNPTKIEATGETIPAQPGEQAPVPKITEEERAQLAELWNDVRASNNAHKAMLIEAQRLDAEKRVAEAEAKTHALVGQQLNLQLQQKIQTLFQKYNIPDQYTIDSKTGIVSPPKNDQPPQADAELPKSGPIGL